MNPIQSSIDYFRSAKAELEKVSWPSRKDTVRYSTIVLVASVAAAAFFGSLDFGLHQGVTALVRRAPAPAAAAPGNINLDNSPVNPDLVPQIQAVDKNGTPVNVNVNGIGTTPSGAKTTNPAGTP